MFLYVRGALGLRVFSRSAMTKLILFSEQIMVKLRKIQYYSRNQYKCLSSYVSKNKHHPQCTEIPTSQLLMQQFITAFSMIKFSIWYLRFYNTFIMHNSMLPV